MKAHLTYLVYLLKHKYYVFLECCKLGILWLGLIHDWHKFLPSEWIPYVHHFYNPDGSKKVITKAGYFKTDDMQDEAFNLATHLHYKRACHHWQSWVSVNADNGVDPLPIPHKYLKEMLADWKGASHAQEHGGKVKEWWGLNCYKMVLDADAFQWLNAEIEDAEP